MLEIGQGRECELWRHPNHKSIQPQARDKAQVTKLHSSFNDECAIMHSHKRNGLRWLLWMRCEFQRHQITIHMQPLSWDKRPCPCSNASRITMSCNVCEHTPRHHAAHRSIAITIITSHAQFASVCLVRFDVACGYCRKTYLVGNDRKCARFWVCVCCCMCCDEVAIVRHLRLFVSPVIDGDLYWLFVVFIVGVRMCSDCRIEWFVCLCRRYCLQAKPFFSYFFCQFLNNVGCGVSSYDHLNDKNSYRSRY